MRILCAGVNHQTAPLEVRQRLAFDRESTGRALGMFRERFAGAEFVILSTCNRVEVYSAAPAAGPPDGDGLLAALAEFHNVPLEDLAPHAYRLQTEEAVRHLMAVASGLDSMVVGESQIIGQTKQAFVQAFESGATGKYLNRLFHRAFHAAKRVHDATEIGRRPTSVASVAVDFASRIFSPLEPKRVLVIGSGEMAERAVAQLQACGCRDVTIVSRTAEHAAALASLLRARARPWDDLDAALAESDILITSTASPEPILSARRMAEVQRRRRWASWLVLDLAVPRDTEPEVGPLRNVYLYDVDALGAAAGENIALREREVDLAGEIVADEVQAYVDWFEARDVGPLVEQLEARLHALGDEELERLFKRLPPEVGDEVRREVRLATHRIVHKLLHEPVEQLKKDARRDEGHLSMRVLRKLFRLDEGRDNPSD